MARTSYMIVPRHINNPRECGHLFVKVQRCLTHVTNTERNLRMIKIQHKVADTYQKEQSTQVFRAEAELTRDYGNHSLAFLGLAPENLHLLTSDGEGLVNYRQTRNAAVVLGDPICSPEAFERVTRSFLNFCAYQKRRVVFYQAYSEHLATYRALKLHAFKMGEEAIIHPQTFTLNGSALANVRTSSRRAEREGVRIQWYEGVPPPEVMQQLECISTAWLESKAGKQEAEMGFSMGKLIELIDTAERAEEVASQFKPSNGLDRDRSATRDWSCDYKFRQSLRMCDLYTYLWMFDDRSDCYG